MANYSGKKVTDAEESDMMLRYEFDLYAASSPEEVVDKLQTFGVCIVPAVLNEEECSRMEDGIWNWLEHVTMNMQVPVSRGDPETFDSFFKLLPLHSMLIQHWGFGHCQAVWDVRQNPKVADVFAHIWKARPEELISSFDGGSIHLPHESTRRGFFRGNSWLHTDQSFSDSSQQCVQAWVTARDVNVGDATLAFIPASHAQHAAFRARFGESVVTKGDWFRLSEEHAAWYEEATGQRVHFVRCPRGSMVLWDSRTIHCGQEALRTRPVPNTRMVAYVCMTPRARATPAVLRRRIKAFEALRMTTHWPHRPALFPKLPRLHPGVQAPRVQPPPPPMLTPLGRRLVGYS